MGYIGSEIFAANYKPAVSHSVLNFFFDDARHFAVFLCFENSLHVSYFFNGRVRNADDIALLLRSHIRIAYKYFLSVSLLILSIFFSLKVVIDGSHHN